MEVTPGIHRIESVLGPRPFSQYLLHDERSLLVDTGCAETPGAVILPYLEAAGVELDLILISHADVDHFGGTAAIQAAHARALVLAHGLDTPWIESSDAIMRERYGWYDAHGLGYPADVFAWLGDSLGPDRPVDVRLRGGEQIRLGAELVVEVLHLAGHTPGHLGLWEPLSRTAIVTDAVMARGLLDTEGRVVHPSPYFDVDAYATSARRLRELRPQRLLTAHYEVIEGADVDRFLADTLAFVEDAAGLVGRVLRERGSVTLAELLAEGDAALGPFSSMPNELAGSLRAHLTDLVAAGSAAVDASGLRWQATEPHPQGGR